MCVKNGREYFGVPAAARLQFYDGHVRLEAEELQGLDGMPVLIARLARRPNASPPRLFCSSAMALSDGATASAMTTDTIWRVLVSRRMKGLQTAGTWFDLVRKAFKINLEIR